MALPSSMTSQVVKRLLVITSDVWPVSDVDSRVSELPAATFCALSLSSHSNRYIPPNIAKGQLHIAMLYRRLGRRWPPGANRRMA
jgi:hypothetical protein